MNKTTQPIWQSLLPLRKCLGILRLQAAHAHCSQYMRIVDNMTGTSPGPIALTDIQRAPCGEGAAPSPAKKKFCYIYYTAYRGFRPVRPVICYWCRPIRPLICYNIYYTAYRSAPSPAKKKFCYIYYTASIAIYIIPHTMVLDLFVR